MIRSALLGGSCHKAIFPLSLGMGLRLGLGANQTGGGGAPPVDPLVVTISGTARMESTLTMDVTGGTQDSQRWQSAPYNAGSPSVWTDIASSTATTKLLDGNQKLLAVRAVATKDGIDYAGDWVGPIIPFYSSTGFASDAVLTSVADAANGIRVKGMSGSPLPKDRLVANKTGTGNFGFASQFATSATLAFMFDDVGSQNQRITHTLRTSPVATASYCMAAFRLSGTDGGANTTYSYLRVYPQTNGFYLQEIVNGVANGAGQSLTAGALSIGTGQAGKNLIMELIGNKLYLALETGIGTGVYSPLLAGGSVVTTLTVTGTECSISAGNLSGTGIMWDNLEFFPVDQGIVGLAAATEDVDFTPSNQRAVVTGTAIGISDIADLELRIETTSGGTTVFDYAQDADNTLASGVMTMYSATSLAAYQGVSLTAKVRNKNTLIVLSSATFTVPIEATPKTALRGINIGYIYQEQPFSDIVRNTSLYVTDSDASQGGGAGYKAIYTPEATVNRATCVQHRDSSFVNMVGAKPTTFPAGTGRLFLLHHYNYDLAYRSGVHAVSCSPGLRWQLTNGATNGSWLKRANDGVSAYTATNEANGDGTIVISNSLLPAGPAEIDIQGYDDGSGYVARTLPAGPDDLFFRAVKAGETGPILAAYVSRIAAVIGSGGHCRFMSTQGMNRGSVVGVSWNPSADGAPTGDDYQTLTDDMIALTAAETFGGMERGRGWTMEEQIALAEACNANLYFHMSDLSTPAAVLKQADYFYATADPATKIYPAKSNETWQSGNPNFRQGALNQARATANGNERHEQQALDTAAMWATWTSATGYDAAQTRLVFEWHYVATTQTKAREVFTACPDIKFFQVGPYGANGGDSYDASSYLNSKFMSTTDRGLALSTEDPAACIALWDDRMTVANDAAATFFVTVCNYVERGAREAGVAANTVHTGTYEHAWQHFLLTNYSSPLKEDTAAMLGTYLRSAAGAAQAVAYEERLDNSGGMRTLFDFAGASVGSSSVITPGVWSIRDRVGPATDAQEPYASLAVYMLTAP